MKKALILCTDLSEKFLPLSKVVPKELWPLGSQSVIHYILQELKTADITQAVFILNSRKKLIPAYFKKDSKLEKILQKKKRESFFLELKNLEEVQKDFSLSFIFQEKPLGNGEAMLQAKTKIGKDAFVVLSCSDIIESRASAIAQLLKIFKTCQRPVIGLGQVPKENTSDYIIAKVEKIANRLFKIKSIVGSPSQDKAPSNLAVIERYVLIPEIFDYLKIQKPNEAGDINLIDALKSVLKDGKIIYGYEIEGKWLECRDKESYLKSNRYLLSKNH